MVTGTDQKMFLDGRLDEYLCGDDDGVGLKADGEGFAVPNHLHLHRCQVLSHYSCHQRRHNTVTPTSTAVRSSATTPVTRDVTTQSPPPPPLSGPQPLHLSPETSQHSHPHLHRCQVLSHYSCHQRRHNTVTSTSTAVRSSATTPVTRDVTTQSPPPPPLSLQ